MKSMERASSIPRVVMQCNAMEGNRREGKVGKGGERDTVTGQNRMHRWMLYGW